MILEENKTEELERKKEKRRKANLYMFLVISAIFLGTTLTCGSQEFWKTLPPTQKYVLEISSFFMMAYMMLVIYDLFVKDSFKRFCVFILTIVLIYFGVS